MARAFSIRCARIVARAIHSKLAWYLPAVANGERCLRSWFGLLVVERRAILRPSIVVRSPNVAVAIVCVRPSKNIFYNICVCDLVMKFWAAL
eukprot:8512628-Lingulodinium_polyedra.AAC.1